jgi:hypothetical protein
MAPLTVLAVAAGFALAYVVFTRSNELFCLSVRKGRTLLVRGRIPPTLFQALADVAQRTQVERATIRAVAGEAHARLVFSGIAEGPAQRMRNVFGTHPVQRLRGATLPAARNAGQVLGIAWLAWLFTNRS